MSLITEVVMDLWEFTNDELGRKSSKSGTTKENRVAKQIEATQAADNELSEGEIADTAYIAVKNAAYYQRPFYAFDTRLGGLPYGTKVSVIEKNNNFVHFAYAEHEGWVERDCLSFASTAVEPFFIPGVSYKSDDSETSKMRKTIADEFCGEVAGLPALNTEYVWYRLVKEERAFSWPNVRPRNPGRWASILDREPSVLVSSVPIAGSVVEYKKNAVDELMYVEKVSIDGSLVLSGFSGDQSGEFRQIEEPDSVWKEKPVKFICQI